MRPSFWLLIFGQAISIPGDFFASIAMSWLVYDLTGSKLAMGGLFLVWWLPNAIVLLVGAPLLDRLNRRKLMVVLDLIRAAIYILPPLLAYFHVLAIWHLYAVQLLAGLVGSLFQPALMATLPSVVGDGDLTRANAWFSSSQQGMTIVGPLLAGLVVSVVGSQPGLVINAASFLVSSISLLFLPAAAGAVRAKNKTGKTNYFRDVAGGFQFFLAVPAFLVLIGIGAFSNIGIMATNTIMIPFVKDHLRADTTLLGSLQTAWGAGFLAGTLVLGWIGTVSRRRVLMLSAFVLQGVALAALGLARPAAFVFPLICQALFGLSSSLVGVQLSTIYQKRVPNELLGRVSAIRLLISQSTLPLGALLGPIMADGFGFPVAFMIAGLAPALVAASGFLMPGLRFLDEDPKRSSSTMPVTPPLAEKA